MPSIFTTKGVLPLQRSSSVPAARACVLQVAQIQVAAGQRPLDLIDAVRHSIEDGSTS